MSRFSNQIGILDIDDYDYLKIAIIGLGSIGSFLALALSKLGFKNLMLIDDDLVEIHNVATQLYNSHQIGLYKTQALKESLEKSENNIIAFGEKVKPTSKIAADVVFFCVDSLKQRKVLAKSVLDSHETYNPPKLIIDGRMHRLLFRVYTIDISNQKLLNHYIKSLLVTEYSGACTQKGIIQNVFGVVAVMAEQLKKVLNNEPYYAEINCDFEHYVFNKYKLIEPIKRDANAT